MIGAVVVTLIAVGVAKETRHHDLTDVEPSAAELPTTAPAVDARTA